MKRTHDAWCAATIACAILALNNRATHSADVPSTETPGKVDAVTVYRGQALVTREIHLSGADGLREVIVTGLPGKIVPDSIFAEATVGATIRSVRYRERPVQRDVREQVQTIETAMAALRDELQTVERRLKTINEQRTYIAKLEAFTPTLTHSDLSRGVLDAESLVELSMFVLEQRNDLAEQELRLSFERRDIQADLEQLERELNALGATSTRTAREAVVLVDLPRHMQVTLNVHYLVNHASWEPSYTIRGNRDDSALEVLYSASIQQTSGEDWSDVAMILSTATPSLVARAPTLSSLMIELQPDLPQQMAQIDQLRSQQWEAASARNVAAPTATRGAGRRSVDEFDVTLNTLARDLQVSEFNAGSDLMYSDAPGVDAGYTVTYDIPSRTDLPSRADRQQIQIASIPLEGEFYKVAIPVLTTFVYDEARTANAGEHVLLAGPISTYSNGHYVGHSDMPDVPMGETMTIGFGVNASLRSDRELIHQDETIQGGNRVVNLTYRLTVENFDDAPTIVRVFDRLPQVKPDQIKLTITDNGAHSERGVQVHKVDRDEGVIRWDVDVPGRAAGDDAATIEYTIRLEYDRQMNIVGMAQ